VAQRVKARTGGGLVAASLEAAGAEVVFGVPGIHALAIWEGLRTGPIRAVGLRTELSAGFAADGYARTSGKPAPLLLSTGPGALISLAALMEAASAHVPVVAIASQIPRDLIGAGRGYLHELADQKASFEPVVKWAARAETAAEIPELVAEGWRRALTPPSGPVFVEIPVDVLAGETDAPVGELDVIPPPLPPPDDDALAEASRALAEARQPVLWAGAGVLRSGAWEELRSLAERLGAPVATTYMGKGGFPADHPLSAGSACDEPAYRELIAGADVVLAVGTELGAETTGQYELRFSGRLVQIDADPRRIGATYDALGLVGDARVVLAALLESLPAQVEGGRGEQAAAEVRGRIENGLEAQDRGLERGLLGAIRKAVPSQAVTAWDMTILAYWASSHFPVHEPRTFLYPLGSGTLGYAWPAALGASLAAARGPTLGVCGDGGFSYGVAELAAARQHGLDTVLLLVDDGGYGILREYQRAQFGETFSVDLEEPDFRAAVEAFGVPVVSAPPEEVGDALAAAFDRGGPAVVHVPALLEMWTPTP
jgi:acetolactate synthase I/II/III large subunit